VKFNPVAKGLKLYRTVIRPIVTYTSQTWVLKGTIIQKLLIFEWKILRRIFGPTKENQIWRIKTNEELDKLIKHKNIFNHLTPNGHYMGRTAQLTSRCCILYIYSKIYVRNILNMLHNLRFFSLFKMQFIS